MDKVFEELDKIIKPKPSLGFEISNDPATVYDSKLGGIPYFPKNEDYPISSVNGEPLSLLAQINFSSIPNIEGFPKEGILQIFIANDEMYGVDFDDNKTQKDFRVIYHKDIKPETELMDSFPEGVNSNELPIEKPYKLIPKVAKLMSANIHHPDFEEEFIKVYNKVNNMAIDEFWSLEDSESSKVYEHDREMCWIGGFPVFAQYDPREGKDFTDYDTLLFELDSLWDNENNIRIMWGDSGTGTFFISSEKLRNLDFSDIFYSWDCC